jgi:hypothetical protein
MKIPFVGPSYQARSLRVDAQRAVNCYLEQNPAGTTPLALYGTPGLTLRATVGTGPHRGQITQGGYDYVVSGSGVYRVDSNWSATLLGTLGTGSGIVGMATNGTEVLIVDGQRGWLATEDDLTLITDEDFPNGVTSAGYLDTFFLVGGDGSGQFYCNESPNTGSAWNGLDFATAEGNPDPIQRLLVDHREAWLVGKVTTEVYVNTGAADFPFERNGSVFIESGTPAPWSVVSMDNSLYMLGQDDTGAGVVYKIQGYNPVRVSTHAIETAIAGYTNITDAVGYSMLYHGHAWYVLSFPSANRTWVYDAATGSWFEWLYRNPNTNSLNRHRGLTHAYFGGKHLVGDWEDGKLYSLEDSVYTDNGDPILRLRATQSLDSDDGESIFYEQLVIEMETGVGLDTGQGSEPLLMMRYSNDSGRTWSNYKTKTIGASGRYGTRVKFGPTGAGRNRVWEISMTDPVAFVVVGASARATRGS